MEAISAGFLGLGEPHPAAPAMHQLAGDASWPNALADTKVLPAMAAVKPESSLVAAETPTFSYDSPAKRRRTTHDAPADKRADVESDDGASLPDFLPVGAVPAFGFLRRVSDKFGDSLLIEEQQGGASVVHVFPEAVSPSSTAGQRRRFAQACFDVIFGETEVPGVADHAFAIIHRGAEDVPNLLRMIAQRYPKTEVVKEVFGQKRLTETVSVESYVAAIDQTLANGTHRAGTMRTISLVGCMPEEKGGFFGDVLGCLERSGWLKDALPWGEQSRYDALDPAESDDGPIMWACPGEQVVPLIELGEGKRGTEPTGARKKRSDVEMLQLLPRNERPREKLVEDRTGCHADMSGLYPERHAVAAVGLVQGMGGSYDLKDIIAFHAGDMDRVAEMCGLYFQEEPKDQLLDPHFWADEAKLNQLRRAGVRYAHVRLRCDDIYFIPRKVVHQFKTVGACVSITWHLKHRLYYSADGVPNQLIGLTTETSATTEASEEKVNTEGPRAVLPVVSPSKKPLMRSGRERSSTPSKSPVQSPSSPAPVASPSVPPSKLSGAEESRRSKPSSTAPSKNAPRSVPSSISASKRTSKSTGAPAVALDGVDSDDGSSSSLSTSDFDELDGSDDGAPL